MDINFELKTLKYHLVYKLTLNYKTWLKQLGAFVGIYTVIFGFLFLTNEPKVFHSMFMLFYLLTSLACGFYITSRSFHELESTGKGFLSMQLPVPTRIKFWVPALFSGLIFPVLFLFFYAGVVDFVSYFWSLFYHFEPTTFKIFDEFTFIFFKLYFIFQSFFLVGSIAFKKQHLLKSALTIATIFAGLLTLWIPVARLAFGTFNHTESPLGNFQITAFGFTYSDVILIVLMAIGWTIAWFKLKEREV